MFRRLSVCILIAAIPMFAPAASKEILDLQRDVAQLQDMVRQLQQSQDRQLAALTEMVRQSADNAQKAYTAVAVIQSSIQQSLRDQEKQVAAPVAGVNTRLDSVGNDVRTMQQAIADLNASVQKIQAQLTDLSNAIKTMGPAPQPPPQGGVGQPNMAGGIPPTGGMQTAGGETPAMSSTQLYTSADRDRTTGKFDLALQEYQQFLKWYGNTDLAPNAQYYIGYIHYSQRDYENAANDFDAVLEKYPDNPKTPDAMYYKGMSLVRVPGRKTAAADEFTNLIKEYPGSDQAKLACNQLKDLGKNCPVVGTHSPARKKTASRK